MKRICGGEVSGGGRDGAGTRLARQGAERCCAWEVEGNGGDGGRSIGVVEIRGFEAPCLCCGVLGVLKKGELLVCLPGQIEIRGDGRLHLGEDILGQVKDDFAGAAVSASGEHAGVQQRVRVQFRQEVAECPAGEESRRTRSQIRLAL